MDLLFTLTLNFAVNISSLNYFIAYGRGSSAELFYQRGFIELLLFEDLCYEQYHLPVENKTVFTYNWDNRTIDGEKMTRYGGNCNITSFDYNDVLYNETCTDGIYDQNNGYDLKYFICFLIPLLLLARSDTIYKAIKRVRGRINLEIEEVYETVVEDLNLNSQV